VSKDNLRVLKGNATPSLNLEMVRKMREELPIWREYLTIQAQMTKAKFDALKAEGFSDQQALELSKTLF